MLGSVLKIGTTYFEWRNLLPDGLGFRSSKPILNSYITDKDSALGANYGVLNDPEIVFDTPIDRAAHLDERRGQMFGSMLHIEKELHLKTVLLDQRHTNVIHFIDEGNVSNFAPSVGRSGIEAGDGAITNLKGVMLCCRAMDCIHLAVKHIHSDYIGVVHSGWRGSLAGINESLIGSMLSRGCPLSELRVFIGPSIGVANYEVGVDLYNSFIERDPDYDRYFTNEGGQLCFDNRAFVIDKYMGANEIVDCDIDVFSNPLFASHRREIKNPTLSTAFAGNVLFIYN